MLDGRNMKNETKRTRAIERGKSDSASVGLGDFNCSIYLGIQAYLYTRLINLGPIDNKAFSRANIP